MKRLYAFALFFVFSTAFCLAAEPLTLNLWPGQPPSETKELPPEADQTKPEDTLIAGRRIIKLDTGAAVVICPGGGYHILAYDLEGTEVAEWLNEIGVTGILLKYRVPFRDPDKRWLAAVQDGQRAMSLVRSKAAEWGIDSKRIGMLGFSAGGSLSGRVSILGDQRQYEPIDAVDKVSSRPDFTVLIYSAGYVERGTTELSDYVKVSSETPPMFFVHAFDDGVSVLNPLLLAAELKKSGVSAEVHVFPTGGHGYGLRHVDGQPVTDWPKLCEGWFKTMGFIE